MAAWLRYLFDGLFTFFSNQTVVLCLLAVLIWFTTYLLLRGILELGGQAYLLYSHKISYAVSVILSVLLTLIYRTDPEIEGFLRATLTGWTGFIVTTTGTIMLAWLAYTSLDRWQKISIPLNYLRP